MNAGATPDLAQRLAEAEATIAALLAGQIDAIVDATTHTPILLAKAQQALRDERDRAQRYLDAPQVILLALDPSGLITLVNRYACSILGYDASELIGRDWFDTCLPVHIRERMRTTLPQALTDNLPAMENLILTRAGDERLVEWRNAVVRDAEGVVVGTFSSGSDITDRRHAETTLQQATADLLERTQRLELQTAVLSEQAALLDLTADAIIVRDMPGNVVFWNRGAEAMYGWSSAEAIGRDTEVLLRTEFSEPIDTINTALLSEGRWDGELVRHTRDGARLDVASRWTLQRDGAGAPFRILSINNDITTRKQADRDRRLMADDLQQHVTALQESEERINYALGAARMGVWEVEIESQRLTWSTTMSAVFGLSPADAPIDLPAFFELIDPEDRRVVGDALAHAGRAGTDFKQEFRVIWPDGSSHWVAGEAHLLHPTATRRSARWLGIGSDISKRKSLEAQFRQAQKMDAIGQLAGGVAHDFNNLLTAILGYSNLVIDTFGVMDGRRRDLSEVIKAGHRATALTRQLLAFSRKQILQVTAVDLNGLVEGMRPMLGRLIGEQVTFSTALAADLGVVRADMGQLEQVLMNLVVNARDAMPSGGRLVVETANISLDQPVLKGVAVQPGPYVLLSVSDTGVGMSEATRARLFEPFFTTKPPGKGTGLGLATAYGIVKQSGGYIWVDSELGRGAVVKVYLPRTSDVETVTRPVESHKTSAGTETVLVVEDEESVRLLTCRILRTAGYRVLDAADAVEAQVQFAAHGADVALLVTDVIMPGLSGPKLFQQLAQDRPALKVLYVSGYTDDTIVHQGQLDPGTEFLQKPFTTEALNRRVREVLDR